jgi:response regulator RpfG family c-di-GMP phosphodiesterase
MPSCAISGHYDFGAARNGQRSQVHRNRREDYLPKPFNPVLLKARVGACLEKKRLRDQEVKLFEQLQDNYAKLLELEKDARRPDAHGDSRSAHAAHGACFRPGNDWLYGDLNEISAKCSIFRCTAPIRWAP